MDEPFITISLPAWRAGDTIRRAVDCLLAQSFERFKLVIVNDGDDPAPFRRLLEAVRDPRIEVIDLPVNQGRYHADHLVLHEHCDTEWFAIHDADDWAEPDWLNDLVEYGEDLALDAVLADHWMHPLGHAPAKISRAVRWDGSPKFLWHGHMAGLYRADFLREKRITNPHVRVAWDAYFTGAVQVLGDCGILTSDNPNYHRVRTPNSLTTSRETGMRSVLRRETTPAIKEAWQTLATDPSRFGSIVRSFSPTRGASDLLVAPRLFGVGWPLSQSNAAELDALLWSRQPRVVLEAGSGHSTLVCGRYARATGATVVSLEHSKQFHRRTGVLLRDHGLADRVDLRLAPLSDGPDPWYQTDLPDNIDFAIIDGPPADAGGRAGSLPALLPHMAREWAMLFDDTDREAERSMVEGWWEEHELWLHEAGTSALLESHPTSGVGLLVNSADVCITVLTGRRPELLARTLASLPPELGGFARVVALHTGREKVGDETDNILASHPYIDARKSDDEVRPIGENVSQLAEQVKNSGATYWLHLEDDWVYDTHHHGWLDDAREILEDPSVAQVRLRHFGEKVMDRSMVDNTRIHWKPAGHHLRGKAHITLNPSLVRVADVDKMWPATGERDMQRNAHRNGLRTVAQHLPGVWRHIGDDVSLRAVTRCEP